jgi:diacylglycerol kinase (ATP)
MKSGKTGLTRIVDATFHSIRGLKACWIHEEAFRQNAALAATLFFVSFWVAGNAVQWLLLVVPLFILIITELLNSAVECTVDRIGHERHELSGRAKDLSSAAVFLCHFLIGTCWIAIIWQNFMS